MLGIDPADLLERPLPCPRVAVADFRVTDEAAARSKGYAPSQITIARFM